MDNAIVMALKHKLVPLFSVLFGDDLLLPASIYPRLTFIATLILMVLAYVRSAGRDDWGERRVDDIGRAGAKNRDQLEVLDEQ